MMYSGEHEIPAAENQADVDAAVKRGEIVIPGPDFIPDEPDFRPTDEKGRIVDVDSMTDRELLIEMVKVTRVVTDKIEMFLNDLPNNPMFGMLSKFLR